VTFGVEDEEIALLEEQLATAHADVERLREQLEQATARTAGLESEAAGLRRRLAEHEEALAQRDRSLEQRSQELEAARASLSELQARAEGAASRYRELLLKSEPSLPSDLVTGTSVEDVDESAERARRTVARVRQHLEEEARAVRIPAGAPGRVSNNDAGELSPAEKIRLGLESR
jgi:regulator of replication initiation timing